MKTNFLQRSKKDHSILKKAVIAVFLLAFVVSIFSFTNLSLSSFFAPVWSRENAFIRSVDNFLAVFRYKRSLEEENQKLRDKIASLESERLASYGWQERERRLLELAGRNEKYGEVATGVLVHPPRSFYDMLIIDGGSDMGLTLGSKVFSDQGSSLGTISEISDNTARVKLFSSPGEHVDGVLERGDLAIELVGSGGGMFKIALPREAEVEIGDKIYAAGAASHLLASVEEVTMRPTDSFKEVLAKSPINIFNIRIVMVRINAQ